MSSTKMNSKTTNISLVGVGGQGILLSSDILVRTAMLAGLDAKKSEVHGMSQRGGSVISQVRFGEKVYSPIVGDGGSDILVSFDRLESLRYRPLLAEGGTALVNDADIVPTTVSSGMQPAVPDLAGELRKAFPRLRLLDANALAVQAGNPKCANVVLTGALSLLLAFPRDLWIEALKSRVPPKLLDVNLTAFALGRGER